MTGMNTYKCMRPVKLVKTWLLISLSLNDIFLWIDKIVKSIPYNPIDSLRGLSIVEGLLGGLYTEGLSTGNYLQCGIK